MSSSPSTPPTPCTDDPVLRRLSKLPEIRSASDPGLLVPAASQDPVAPIPSPERLHEKLRHEFPELFHDDQPDQWRLRPPGFWDLVCSTPSGFVVSPELNPQLIYVVEYDPYLPGPLKLRRIGYQAADSFRDHKDWVTFVESIRPVNFRCRKVKTPVPNIQASFKGPSGKKSVKRFLGGYQSETVVFLSDHNLPVHKWRYHPHPLTLEKIEHDIRQHSSRGLSHRYLILSNRYLWTHWNPASRRGVFLYHAGEGFI